MTEPLEKFFFVLHIQFIGELRLEAVVVLRKLPNGRFDRLDVRTEEVRICTTVDEILVHIDLQSWTDDIAIVLNRIFEVPSGTEIEVLDNLLLNFSGIYSRFFAVPFVSRSVHLLPVVRLLYV